nr:UvrD-helicase domain-containing protein [Lachnospiraceae bacterium]
MAFTEEQLRAIKSRGEDLLVSAAAGSGKTTVLVERIIRRILDDKSPVDIDRILVMTFTKAAAEQMKEKIIKAIDEKRAHDPLNRHLIRQSALVHNAKISTIHGFCLDVIRNHFQEIGVDPDFRVADEAEAKLLKKDVLEKVIEEAYEKSDDSFINMVECLAGGKNDNVLEDMLDRLYDFSMSSPEPEEWLRRCEEIYKSPENDTAWLKLIM